MLFEWDENKNRINKARHKVDFATAAAGLKTPITMKNAGRLSAMQTAHCYYWWFTRTVLMMKL
jgi:uncharacterized DUF497 family protein